MYKRQTNRLPASVIIVAVPIPKDVMPRVTAAPTFTSLENVPAVPVMLPKNVVALTTPADASILVTSN